MAAKESTITESIIGIANFLQACGMSADVDYYDKQPANALGFQQVRNMLIDMVLAQASHGCPSALLGNCAR